ncbi:MAG: helix-turn-helix domain-containing protein [Planctomycetes bacterium]|nr:helix-turn-helix domain-containing protein [Planctomycetota bacterium]
MAAQFKRQLRTIRERLGLTQAFAAKTLGVSPPRISEWERGVRTPKPLTQEAILMKLKAGAPKRKSAGATKKKKMR